MGGKSPKDQIIKPAARGERRERKPERARRDCPGSECKRAAGPPRKRSRKRVRARRAGPPQKRSRKRVRARRAGHPQGVALIGVNLSPCQRAAGHPQGVALLYTTPPQAARPHRLSQGHPLRLPWGGLK